MAKATDFPLTDFRDWLKTQTVHKNTVHVYVSVVRSALRNISDPQDSAQLADYADGLPGRGAAQFRSAWAKYAEFTKNVPSVVVTKDSFKATRDEFLGTTVYLEPLAIHLAKWQHAVLDFEPYGLALPGGKWFDLRPGAVTALRRLRELLSTAGKFDSALPIVTDEAGGGTPLSVGAIYRVRRSLGLGRAEKGDVVAKVYALLKSEGFHAEDIAPIADLIRTTRARLGEAQPTARVISIQKARTVPVEPIREQSDDVFAPEETFDESKTRVISSPEEAKSWFQEELRKARAAKAAQSPSSPMMYTSSSGVTVASGVAEVAGVIKTGATDDEPMLWTDDEPV
jgi:hypothetical protein